MKKCSFFTICILFVCPSVYGQQCDGPYVFYKGDSIIIKSLANTEIGPKPEIISEIKTDNLSIHVPLDNPSQNFEVRLKVKIQNELCLSKKPSKLLILSDIEGEFGAFRNLLLANKVIDNHYNWIFGRGSLVIAGDLFDRGKQVSQFLWLLYKLEDEAKEKKGSVHVILGNHDIMNLSGDFRYVQRMYFKNAQTLGESYNNLYGPATEIGLWLRSKNIVEKIGDLLILHAGIAQNINTLNLPLDSINRLCRPFYSFGTDKDHLSYAGIFAFFSGQTSPFWYRGYFLAPRASMSQIDSTLTIYHCKKIIVGHDVIDHVDSFYGGKVIGVDVDEHLGIHEGLLIENNKYYRVDDQGHKILLH